jgi:hypothetical protein
MREIGDMVDDNVTQGPLRLRLSAFPAGTTRISNRKSGIRIHVKAPEISIIQISNRKYFAVSDLRFLRFRRFLIYGSAIKYPRKALKI